mmetsp:Transcript_16060/g.27089  ORF Transcript_16060/g.27089 Transcript_16060/m.27089 type:complete len:368 (-) Transcript_16060:1185-2288(-)
MSSRIGFSTAVFAVQPSGFGTNPEALLDNKFMKQEDSQNSEEFGLTVDREHQTFVSNIRAAGIQVTVLPQMGENAPDAVFPDWFTCYKGDSIPEGVLIIHPMKYLTRRNERTPEIIARLQTNFKHTIDLTHFEDQAMALEGKGAIVFDHRNRKFYIARSNRAHVAVINYLVERWNELCVDGDTRPYEAVTFEAHDQHGDVIYHTDCLMTLHGNHALVCKDALRNPKEKQRLIDSLTGPTAAYPVEIIELSLQQIEHMSANAQNLINEAGQFCIVMSKRGFSALTPNQQSLLNANYRMVVTNVDNIEHVGGGSCRCMLAEDWGSTQIVSESAPLSKLAESKKQFRDLESLHFLKQPSTMNGSSGKTQS